MRFAAGGELWTSQRATVEKANTAVSFVGVAHVSTYSQCIVPPIETDPDLFDGQKARVWGVHPLPPVAQGRRRWTATGAEEDQRTVNVPWEALAAGTVTDSRDDGGVACPSSWLVDCCVTVGAGASRSEASAPPPTTRKLTPTTTNQGRIASQGGELPKNHSTDVEEDDSRGRNIPRRSNTPTRLHVTL